LLTVYGGKLTTYRLTAERVMARLADALPVRAPLADTRYLELT
jgi:glycerol-3-phosphate dehydrogenase